MYSFQVNFVVSKDNFSISFMYAWFFVPLTVVSFVAISLCTHVVAWKLEPIFLDSCFKFFSDLKLMLKLLL